MNSLQFGRDFAYGLRIREPHRRHNPPAFCDARAGWGRGYSRTSESEKASMPSLLRLLTVIAIACGVVYGGLYALAHFVKPSSREMSVSISPTKFYKER
jgi:hypothetical protein